MPEVKPQAAGQNVWSFVKDVSIAGGAAALGGAVGCLILLSVVGLVNGEMPKISDLVLLPWAGVLGLMEGAIGGLILRICVGKILRQRLWAIGFFIFGGIGGTLALIALVAYSIGFLQPIIIAARVPPEL